MPHGPDIASPLTAPSPSLETVDSIFRGAVQLRQHTHGYRFSIDALLLAGAVRLPSAARILDLGCGCGVVGLALAHLLHPRELVAIEVQPRLAALARANAERNGFMAARVLEGDVRGIRQLVPAGAFDAVVCNPPYHAARAGRVNPDSERAAARHQIHGDLGDFLAAARYALAPRGRAYFVYPAARLQELAQALSQARLGLVWLQCVHPDASEPASRVIACARPGDGGPARVRPPIAIHAGGRHTDLLTALLAGEAPPYPGEDDVPGGACAA